MQITKLVVTMRGEALINPRVPLIYMGFKYRSVHDGERRGFTVKLTAKYVDECFDIVQLQNAKAVNAKKCVERYCELVLLEKRNACPWKTKLWMQAFDDEAIEVQHPHADAVGRGPTKLEIAHHVSSGHAQHRTWCDACMRALGIAGRRERRESGREDEDSVVAMDYGYWKLDGTEDDDHDEDDEVAQNKLLILVAKDLKSGTYAATCLREKGVSEYATSWTWVTPGDTQNCDFCWQLHLSNWFCEKAQLVNMPPMVLLSLPCVR